MKTSEKHYQSRDGFFFNFIFIILMKNMEKIHIKLKTLLLSHVFGLCGLLCTMWCENHAYHYVSSLASKLYTKAYRLQWWYDEDCDDCIQCRKFSIYLFLHDVKLTRRCNEEEFPMKYTTIFLLTDSSR